MATEGISPEEQALLDELDAEIAAGGSGEGDDNDDGAGDDTATGSEGDDTVEAGAGDDTIKGADDEPAPADKLPLVLEADDAEAKALLETLSADKKALRKKYDEGDIDRDEYDAAVDALNDKIADAKLEVQKASMYRDITEKVRVGQWNEAVSEFMQDPKNAVFRADGPLHLALDAKVRQMNADPEVVKKFPNNAARLEEAKRVVLDATRKALGVETPAKTPSKKPAVEIPPSVDDILSADEEQDDEFAYLDRLKGTAREEAYNKLTPEQRRRYLEGA